MAKELSTATKTVTDAVTIYANENESVSSMLNKAQPTVLLSAASGMSSSSSADAISWRGYRARKCIDNGAAGQFSYIYQE